MLQYVCVRVNAGQLMTFGGSDDPCGMVELESLGVVGGAKNKELVPVIGSHVQEALGIPQDRSVMQQGTDGSHQQSCAGGTGYSTRQVSNSSGG